MVINLPNKKQEGFIKRAYTQAYNDKRKERAKALDNKYKELKKEFKDDIPQRKINKNNQAQLMKDKPYDNH